MKGENKMCTCGHKLSENFSGKHYLGILKCLKCSCREPKEDEKDDSGNLGDG